MGKTKKTILEAAIKTFSIKGFEGATMDEVALEGKVAKGTLYYHFKSKEELFNYMIMQEMKSFKEGIDQELAAAEDTISKIRMLIKVNVEHFYNSKDFFKVLISQLWGVSERQNELRRLLDDYLKYISGILKEGIDRGIIEDNDPYFLAHVFFGAVISVSIYEIINLDKDSERTYDFDKATDKLLEYFLNAIKFDSTKLEV
ncbi:TetR/AcrR family transcriptional regulator [Clostridium cellulovorans]|uniref:Transcriptional regulator, TetR family n=1 Tax=Clostridium cellulovorans (strain ATCC 35296 / DSM 3052 / OCM 3 / 743B) TaxID=573061 RepID=D9SSA3_CLOC7|nr:TetR/AcrR family transcriptional regulator [Clostridium cellulovorans]ADL52550.1 transcriptional regulator, TetR family [Clostridium cellulovorans 743B]